MLPTQPGAYRWYYADATAGELTAVVIFMVGAVFSPRYSVAARRGGSPMNHCAVNYALYRKGMRQQWVLSEYPSSSIADDGHTLRIGASSLRHERDGRLTMQVVERTLWGKRIDVQLELTPESHAAAEVPLVRGQPHYWQLLAPRCRSSLAFANDTMRGTGYHDTNWGEEPLGGGISGWQWIRLHGETDTRVRYRPNGSDEELQGFATQSETTVRRVKLTDVLPADLPRERRTRWGLRVPGALAIEGVVGRTTRLLESSPFYARLEASAGPAHLLGEVADFKTFHRPYVRWMARLRTRRGARA